MLWNITRTNVLLMPDRSQAVSHVEFYYEVLYNINYYTRITHYAKSISYFAEFLSTWCFATIALVFLLLNTFRPNWKFITLSLQPILPFPESFCKNTEITICARFFLHAILNILYQYLITDRTIYWLHETTRT